MDFRKILLNMSFTVVDHVVNSHDLHVPRSRSKGDLFKKQCLSGNGEYELLDLERRHLTERNLVSEGDCEKSVQ